jgi:hypothetical protein
MLLALPLPSAQQQAINLLQSTETRQLLPGLCEPLLVQYLQTISEELAGVLQRATNLQSSWGDDFVSAEHLLQVSLYVCLHDCQIHS